AAGLARLEVLDDEARDYAAAARAANTRRAYRADWADFTAWCDLAGLQSLPATPSTVTRYLTSQAGLKKMSTLQRRLSAISQAHQAAGYESPTRNWALRESWRGMRNKHGTAQEGKAPTLVED